MQFLPFLQTRRTLMELFYDLTKRLTNSVINLANIFNTKSSQKSPNWIPYKISFHIQQTYTNSINSWLSFSCCYVIFECSCLPCDCWRHVCPNSYTNVVVTFLLVFHSKYLLYRILNLVKNVLVQNLLVWFDAKYSWRDILSGLFNFTALIVIGFEY